jgi:alpha-N-arabinofuranosidase
MHNTFSFATSIDYKPASEKDLAGITCLQNERFNYVFGITKKGKDTYILLERTEKGQSTIMASAKIEIKKNIRLQVKATGDSYEFSYALNGTDFKNLGEPVSGDILSTNVAGGFTGALVGLYATAANDAQPQ